MIYEEEKVLTYIFPVTYHNLPQKKKKQAESHFRLLFEERNSLKTCCKVLCSKKTVAHSQGNLTNVARSRDLSFALFENLLQRFLAYKSGGAKSTSRPKKVPFIRWLSETDITVRENFSEVSKEVRSI